MKPGAAARRTRFGANLSGFSKWSGIAAGPDGKLYCAPYVSTDILVIDPESGTAHRTNMGANLIGSGKWNGIAGEFVRLFVRSYPDAGVERGTKLTDVILTASTKE